MCITTWVEASSQFQPWLGGDVSKIDQNYERSRLGAVVFSSKLSLHIDVLKNKVHFPSYYELIDVKTEKTLIKLDVFTADTAEWYFSGNGNAYLFQQDTNLCGPWKTRKIVKSGDRLVEVVQPLTYLGYETEILVTTPLFDSPGGREVIATIAAGNKATVVGMIPWKNGLYETAFMVKTAYGLTGWHRPQRNNENGVLQIYQCN